MIIVISFFGVAFISAINVESTYNERTNHEFITDDIIKDQSAYKTSEYKDYIISKEKKDDKKDIIFYNRGHFFKQKAGLTDSEITPLKTILNSLNYSKNCESITIDLNLKMKNWKEWYIKYPTTPILCTQKEDHFIPLGIPTEYKGDVNNIIFDYKIGDSVIYLKNFDKNMKYTGAGGINLQIDTLFIGHHYGTVSHSKTVNLALNESEYKFKWCEKCKIKNN
ncbi:MAG: hypothetical protein MJY54_00060 [archaeon]|nr:hypothetical protein [archaeon]